MGFLKLGDSQVIIKWSDDVDDLGVPLFLGHLHIDV